jgi:DNA-binding NarL/FixJ family response regulator
MDVGGAARAGPDALPARAWDDLAMSRTVLIVDDHDEFRRVVRALLEQEGYEVVGEAGDGGSALVAAERLRPQLVLLDIQLPDLDGFQVAAQLAETDDPPTVVLTSIRDPAAYRRRLRETGLAFVSKSDLSGQALAAFVT